MSTELRGIGGGSERVVYVLGAGASRALVKTPLGLDLVWTYNQDCDPLVDKRDYKKFLELVGELFQEFLGESQKFESAEAKSLMYFAPIERLRKCHYVDEIFRGLRERGDDKGVALLQRLILKHIVSRGNENHLGYELLKQRYLWGAGISVVSFNFDTYLNEQQPGLKINYRLPFDWRNKNRISYSPQEGIPLIKLNGSLDWAVCSNGHLGLLHYFVRDDTFAGTRCGAPNCGNKIAPLIVTPHDKSLDPRLERLWQDAGQLLEEAERIVIVGYSFPDYDERMIKLFDHKVTINTDVEVIDNRQYGESEQEAESRIRDRYRKNFSNLPSQQLKIWTKGLEEYIQEGNS